MTITHESTTAVAYGTSSAAPTYPASLAAGDLILMPVGTKPVNANSISWSGAVPSGWAIGVQKNNAGGYSTTLAADTGNTSAAIFYRISDGTESGSLTFTPGGTGGSDCVWATMMRLSKTRGVWDIGSAASSDTAAGNLSLLMDADPGISGGDFLVSTFVDPTNATTGANFSAEAMTCPGVVLGSVTEVAEPVTSLGLNVAGLILTCPVTSGDSTGPLTVTATVATSTNAKGPGTLLRIRENYSPVGLLPFPGLSHHDDELTARRTSRRRSGLHVPRRDLTLVRAA